MRCEKHKNNIVMHAFSKGVCEVCKQEFDCAHTPCDNVCQACSEKQEICEVCREKISNQDEHKG